MLKKILIFIILFSAISYASLSNYPEPFVKDNLLNNIIMVIGSRNVQTNTLVATDIALGLPTNKGTSKTLFDTEIKAINGNLIVIGTPCNNKITAELLETNDCHSGLNKGEAMLELIQQDNNAILIVTAYGNEELRNLGKIVRDYNNYKQFFTSDTLLIKGSSIEQYNYIPKKQEQAGEQKQIEKPSVEQPESLWTRFINWLKSLFS
ncbi:MAG: hypothetical protein AB1571_00180 [Nanoarchaeota archaeon]